MRFFRALKREVHCIHLSIVLIFATGSLLLGILSALIGGGHSLYYHICLPRIAPSAFCMWLIWTMMYLLLGASAGIVVSGTRCCRSRLKHSGIIWWIIGLLLNLLWFPLFFGAGRFLLSLLLVPILVFIALLTVLSFLRSGLLPALLMLIYALWLIVCFFLQIAVILCN